MPRGPRRPAAAEIVAEIAPARLLIAHGTADWLLGTHHARDLFNRATHPKALSRPLLEFRDRYLLGEANWREVSAGRPPAPARPIRPARA